MSERTKFKLAPAHLKLLDAVCERLGLPQRADALNEILTALHGNHARLSWIAARVSIERWAKEERGELARRAEHYQRWVEKRGPDAAELCTECQPDPERLPVFTVDDPKRGLRVRTRRARAIPPTDKELN